MRSKKIIASDTFTSGPASDIFPFLLVVTWPEINTAPGAANIKPTNEKRIATTSIRLNARNSAKQPYFCASFL